MANLKDVIYISNEDYSTLVTTGTVVIDGETLTYDENNVYVTPDKLASSTEDGLMSSTDKVKLDSLPTFGTAASKDFTTSVTSGSDDLVTSGAVYSAIDALPEPMIFKGTLGTGGTITTLPTASSENEGFTYKVITDGTYASQAAKVGDLFISNGSAWTLVPAGDDAGEDTVRQINVNGTELLGTAISTGYVNFKNGSNVSISGSGHDVTISATDTTYSEATTTASGLMSASDKVKLNGIASGAEVNVQSDWNVTDSSSDAFIKNKPSIPSAQVNSDWNATSGVAEILNKPNLATVATSGSYNDLTNKPTIDNNNQKVKAGSVTFGDNDEINIVAGDNVTVTGLASGTGAPKITISATDTDTGATSVETTGSGNVVNSASYDASTRKLTLSKGVTALTSHQSIKTLKTDNTTAQSTSSSEAITGSGTINLHKVAKTGTYSDLIGTPTIPTVNDGTLTIQAEGNTKGTFTANQSGDTTINITKDDFVQSKTYTGLIATANEYKNATFYFMNVRPITWNKEWRIRYRIEAHLDDGLTPTNYARFNSIHDCEIIGARGITNAYAYFNGINDTSYRPINYNITHCTTEAGFNAEYPHKIGVELTSSASQTDVNYKRTIKITLLSCDGCEVTFNDVPEIPAQSTRTDYTKINATYYPNGADSNSPGYAYRGNLYGNGLQETSDNNDQSLLYYYNQYMTIGEDLGLCGYCFFGFDGNGNVLPISKRTSSYTSYSADISEDRVYNSSGFDWSRGLFRYASSGYKAESTTANISFDKVRDSVDFRYTDNLLNANNTPLTMVGTKLVYLRGTIGSSDGLFHLAPIEVTHNNKTYERAWTQDVPTTEDGYVYWLVGFPYNSNTYTCNLRIYVENPLFWFKNGEFREYNSATLPNASAAGKVLKSTNTTGGVEWGDAPATGVTDVKIGTSSVVSSGVATIQTNSIYNASSNKIATMSDLPPTITISTGTTKSVSDGTNTLTFGSNAFNSTAIPTSYIASSSYNSSTRKLTITPNSGTATEVTFGSNAFNSTTIPTSYIASASVSGNTLTITPNSGSAVTFTPSFSESDTLATVTSRGATTSTAVTMSGGLDVTGNNLKLNKISAPTSSGGSTYGNGSNGQVLKSNGTTVYWASDSNADHYPTTFTWTNGTTSGPTGSLTGNSGFTAVSFGAIPTASASQSGIVTTGNQTFAGSKTFNNNITIVSETNSSKTATIGYDYDDGDDTLNMFFFSIYPRSISLGINAVSGRGFISDEIEIVYLDDICTSQIIDLRS